MTAVASSPSARSARLGLRATPEQEVVLRRAAEVAHKSLTDFILDSACLAAEQTLLDQRLFMVSGSQSFSAGLPQSKPSSRCCAASGSGARNVTSCPRAPCG